MKTKMKLFILSMLMIVGMGNVMGQYEIAVKNDSGQWIAGNWKVIDSLFNIQYNEFSSKFNFKDQSISVIGGDTIYLQMVDTSDAHNIIPCQKWQMGTGTNFANFSDIDSANIIDASTIFYVLSDTTTYYKIILAWLDTTNVDSGYVKIPLWSKFLSPTFEITDTIVNVKSSSVDLTLADFGLEIDILQGASDTAYYT